MDYDAYTAHIYLNKR